MKGEVGVFVFPTRLGGGRIGGTHAPSFRLGIRITGLSPSLSCLDFVGAPAP